MIRILRFRVNCLILASTLLLFGNSSCAQKNLETPQLPDASADQTAAVAGIDMSEDHLLLTTKIEAIKDKKLGDLSIGDRVTEIGKLFLGTPYVGGTLEVAAPDEPLVVNLRGLDCVTFYENALALARGACDPLSLSDSTYLRELEYMRYRGGRRDGYASRLHYSSDYFFDAAKKGITIDVTKQVAKDKAILDTRTINFMSTHRNSYKQLASDAEYAKVQQIEADMKARGGYYYIPKAYIAGVSSGIQTGDIIGVVTSIDGLDMSHTGIAVREQDGRVRFMHASSALKKVVISDGTLAEYLNGKQIGIVVHRPLENKKPN